MEDTSVKIQWNAKNVHHLNVDGIKTVGELRCHMSYLRGMTDNVTIDTEQLVIELEGKILDDNIPLTSLTPESSLMIKTAINQYIPPLEKEYEDITLLLKRLRDVTREDLPTTQQRHLIQEHQRKSSAAVIEAMNRSQRHSGALKHVEEPIPEDGLIGEQPGPMDTIRSACEPLLGLMESREGLDSHSVSSAVFHLVDGIASINDFSKHDDIHDIPLARLLAARPIDRSRLAMSLSCLCHTQFSATDSRLAASRKDATRNLTELISSNADEERIAEAIETLIKSVFVDLRSPSSGRSLLPIPMEKASMSPELLKWAQGLRPKHKGSR